MKKELLIPLLISILILTISACTPRGVGEPCEPEVQPDGGFKEGEVALEIPSLQCRTRICIVAGKDPLTNKPAAFCTKKCSKDSDCEGEIKAVCGIEIKGGSPQSGETVRYCIPEIYLESSSH